MADPTYAPLYAGGPAQADTVFLQNLPASLDFSTQAAFDESLSVSPSRWLGRYLQQEGVIGDDTQTPLVPVEAAQDYLKAGGFDPSTITEPIHQATLKRLTDRLYEKRAHDDAVSRGPGGFLAGAARFGAGLVAQALDPLNIAAGFIPIFRASTIDTLLGEAGASALSRAAVRAKIGAVEGAVGTAMMEPGMHFLAGQLHEDYTMADSFLNVAFGTVLGGGLHVGVGAVADWRMKAAQSLPPGAAPEDVTPPIHEIPPQPGTPQRVAALSPEARIELGRVALAQAIDGRDIDIAATLDMAEITQRAIDQERQPGFLKSAEDLFAQRQEERMRNQPGFLQTALDKLALRELDETRAAEDARIQERISGEIQQEIGKVQDAQRRELEQKISQQTPDVNAAQLADLMEAQQIRKDLVADPARLAEAAAARDLTPGELKTKLERMIAQGERDLNTYKRHVLASIGRVSPDVIARLNGERRPIAERLHETAVRGQQPESRIRPADEALSKEADQIIETNKTPEGETETAAAQKELQDELTSLKHTVKQFDFIITKKGKNPMVAVIPVSDIETHFDHAIESSVGGKSLSDTVAYLRGKMGIPENVNIHIEKVDRISGTRVKGGTKDSLVGGAARFNPQKNRFEIKVVAARPAIIAHELEHVRDMLTNVLRESPEDGGFLRGHHDQQRFISELSDELGFKANSDEALDAMFAAHDEAIKQAKEDTKVMTAIAQCRLRKG